MSQSAFSSKSSKYHRTQTARARELKFWEYVHPPQHVTCHMSHDMSHVTCHMSHVTCCMSPFFFFFSFWLLLFWTKWWGILVEGLMSTGHTRLVYQLNSISLYCSSNYATLHLIMKTKSQLYNTNQVKLKHSYFCMCASSGV